MSDHTVSTIISVSRGPKRSTTKPQAMPPTTAEPMAMMRKRLVCSSVNPRILVR
jgi:hypothetical protein